MNGSDAFLIEALGYSNAILCDAGSIFDAIEFDFPILGSKINWELGLARLTGGYFSPIAREFVELCKVSFTEHEKALRARR